MRVTLLPTMEWSIGDKLQVCVTPQFCFVQALSNFDMLLLSRVQCGSRTLKKRVGRCGF